MNNLVTVLVSSADKSGKLDDPSVFFSREAFGLLVVDTLSHVVDSFEPYLEIVEATVAVAVVVDGYTNLRIGHITHKLVALCYRHRHYLEQSGDGPRVFGRQVGQAR